MTIPLLFARTMADATWRRGREDGAAPLAVAVLDAGGHVKVVLREDDAGFLRVDIATAKAWGALGMAEPSRQLAMRAAKRPGFHQPGPHQSGPGWSGTWRRFVRRR